MYAIMLVVSALGALVRAAPVDPVFNKAAALPGNMGIVSDYFNMLAVKIEQSRRVDQLPVCDLSQASIPLEAATTLPAPSSGLSLAHVAIGRGTQNYTCDVTNTTAVPVQIGAMATLFNASCIASAYPDLLALIPAVALMFDLTASESLVTNPSGILPPAGGLSVSGKHFFLNSTTPFFDLNFAWQMGTIPAIKNSSAAAPAGAVTGPSEDGAVPWLRLVAREGATEGLQEVYRVVTAGGSAPSSCKDMAAAFEVQYAAQYWFYKSTRN